MSDDTITLPDEPINATIEFDPPITIEFDPPINVNPLIILGDAVVTRAVIQSQPDPTQVVASLEGIGFQVPLVIGVPFVTDDETSLRTYLS